MLRVADYVAGRLAELGAEHVFMLTGGGAMFLNDAFGHEPRLTCVFNHHEQAGAFAAECYARIRNLPAVLNVTTGPGGINALNGVFGAWVDSIPMLVVSGQVKRETCLATYTIPGLRQLGDQEADILSLVRGITKYAVFVDDPATIRYHLEKAWHLARRGRPGPCWLDIPIDVQSTQVDPETLKAYDPADDPIAYAGNLPEICAQVAEKLAGAKRPVILAGKGIRLGEALAEFESVIRRLQIPVVPGWTSIDLLPADDPLFCGVAGDLGTRAGNFTVQNADVLLILGNRLGLRQVSYNWGSFARAAYKIQVDVDDVEARKPTVHPDLFVHSDVKPFLAELLKAIPSDTDPGRRKDWLDWCKERQVRYPVVQPRQREPKNGTLVNPYHFMDRLYANLAPDDIVVCGNGTANVVGFQTARIQKGQRLIANTGDASMGYDLPAAIGAAVARPQGRVVCLAGDGSLQLNLQELQTLVQYRLPVKLFVLNNNGYLSIRLSQANMFKRLTGEGPASGVSFPDIVKLAEAYGLPAIRLGWEGLEAGLGDFLAWPGSAICEVLLDPDQPFEPRIASRPLPDGRIVSSPLEDMSPFLSDEELQENLFIPSLRQKDR
jgi:acetolactate synthase I/II/III large subunit